MAEAETGEETVVEDNKPGAYISERHRNPAEMMAVRQKSSGNYLFAGICAILATLVCIAVVAMLWFDWTALKIA